MAQQRLLEQLRLLAEPLARSRGLALWGIEISSGPRMVLRVYLEKEPLSGSGVKLPPEKSAKGAPQSLSPESEIAAPQSSEPARSAQGVDVDECAAFSRLFGLALDVEDIMPSAYVLEVSSPGFERIFFTASQLAAAVGSLVDITFVEAPEGRAGKKFRGILSAGPLPEKDLPDESRFVLRLDRQGRPGDLDGPGGENGAGAASALEGAGSPDGAELLFAFADLKKARQVWVMPEKIRPGKGGGKTGGKPAAQKGLPEKNKKN